MEHLIINWQIKLTHGMDKKNKNIYLSPAAFKTCGFITEQELPSIYWWQCFLLFPFYSGKDRLWVKGY